MAAGSAGINIGSGSDEAGLGGVREHFVEGGDVPVAVSELVHIGVPGDLHGVHAILVTSEPEGGSRLPTHAPVIYARMS